ncbi:MAG: hypothetical protein HY077_07040 [Elusimicrobia bacterium]|nr:hypothetical protein [Elusimicrobiota bacterium]
MRRTPRLSPAPSASGLFRSLTASLAAFALIALSPGLPCYQALAADLNAGAPKGADIRIIPALDLNQIKTGGVQVPGAEIPSVPGGVIPQTGVPAVPGAGESVIPTLPTPAPGLSGPGAPGAGGADAELIRTGAVDRPLAETTLRTGADAIEAAETAGRGGILTRFWSGSSKGNDAGAVQTGSASDEKVQAALSNFSVADLKAIARDQSRPSAERMSAVKAIANKSDDPAKLALEEIGTGAPVGDARDYEVRRQALSALAGQGKLVSLPAISQAHKEEILSNLSRNKPEAAAFDYDGTLDEDGKPTLAETGAALKSVADAGVETMILTGRLDRPGTRRKDSMLDTLGSLPAEQKAAISVGTDRGGKIFVFDPSGEPQLVRREQGWTEDQKALINTAATAVGWKYGLETHAGQTREVGDFEVSVYLNRANGPDQVAKAASLFQEKLKEYGISVEVMGREGRPDRPPLLGFHKIEKAAGVATLRRDRDFFRRLRVAYGRLPRTLWGAATKALGAVRSRTVAASKTVLVGDYFFGENNVDGGMVKGAPGALALAVGGTADPRLEGVFVWPTTGHAAAMEIAAAISRTQPQALQAESSSSRSKLRSWLAALWNSPGPKAPGPDDPINTKTLLGLVLPRLVGMTAYMLVTLAFVGAAVPIVGWTGYGILMSLSPMAGIAAANIMGNMVKSMGARNAMIINGALRVISLSALPLFHLFGIMNMGTLLVGALAEGWLLSSIMTTEGSFLPALFPSKQLGNINGALFMMFPAVQVVLGIWLHVGRFADSLSPFLIFAGAAALNLFVALPLVWLMIPNTKLAQNQPAAAPPAAPKVPLKTRAAAFVKKYWKPIAALAAGVGLFVGLTWGLPALAAAGIGGKVVAAAAAFMKLHPALTAPLPIVGTLVYWITRTDGFKALAAGKAAKLTDAEKALRARIAELETQGEAKADELAAARAELKPYRGRQLITIGLMALGTLMFYPLYLVATPHIAEQLVGTAGKLEMAGQFLGALFFGNLISTAARTKLPGFSVTVGGRKIAVNTTRLAQGAVVALAGLFAATKIFVAGTLLGSIGVAAAAMAVAVGLIALASRVTDRGWIKAIGIGFAAVWLPFVVWTWPALIPFLTVKTAMLLALLAAGVVNGPNFVSLISYLMGNTERSENSKVTGVQGAFFNAAISTGYALLTIASGFLNPAYPAVLAILGLANLAIGAVFWRAPGHLPGLAPTNFIPKPKKAAEAPAAAQK